AEVLTDDLVARVALQTFGARVPGGDETLGVEGEDGVLGRRLRQQGETLVHLRGPVALGPGASLMHGRESRFVSVSALAPPAVDHEVEFERVWLDETSWVDAARGWL